MSMSSLSSFFSEHCSIEDAEELRRAESRLRFAMRPQMPNRQLSEDRNREMRELIKPWAGLSGSPPACQQIMYASWTRFSPSEKRSKSSDDMQASRLLAAAGTSPVYNPPMPERVYLGVEQDKSAEFGKVEEETSRARARGGMCPFRRIQSNLSNSWSTESESASSSSEPITFGRQAVRSISTKSLLSTSFESKKSAESGQLSNPLEILSDAIGKGTLSASMLPSAWDSDSEDEEYDDDEVMRMATKKR